MIFINNKYTQIYYKIIEKAKARNLTTKKEAKCALGYAEQHHIIPKSLGGDNSKTNLIFLSGREHFICHWLLVKMTTGKSYEKMVFALNGMQRMSKHQSRYNNKVTSRVYAKYKLISSEIRATNQRGVPHSAESNKKRSTTQTGIMRGAYNSTQYTFYHYSGLSITCTCYDLYTQYNVSQGNLAKMISKNSKVKCVNGWSLSPNTAGKKGFNQRGISNPASDKKLYTFYNKSLAITESMTQFDFKNKYSLCKSNISAVVRGRQRSYKGWIIL